MGIKALSGPTPESLDFPIPINQGSGRNLVVGSNLSGFGYTTIQEAVTAAASGDVIYVQPGEYDENIVVTTDYLTIVGAQLGGYGRPDVIASTGVALVVRAQGFVSKKMRFGTDADTDGTRVEGNGFRFEDCVFDGNGSETGTHAPLRLWCNSSDDSFTASEGVFKDCYVRGSGAKGLVIDCQNAAVGVLPSDDVFQNIRFAANVGEDIFLAATAVSVTDLTNFVFDHCHIGIGGKNKATHVDLKTNAPGVAGTVTFTDCYINDDTIDTTALKADGVGVSFIGCYSLDGVINGDAID